MTSLECSAIAVILVGLILLVIWIMLANKLSKLSGQVNVTIGTLAAQYQQRFDLIPDALRAAKEAVKAQQAYLDQMLAVRKGMHPGVSPMDLGTMPPDLAPLMAAAGSASGRSVSESNPALLVEAYTELQRIMHSTEKDVTAARRFYWAAVSEYNVAIRSFPSAIVAAVHGHRQLPDAVITRDLERKPDYFS